jgi:hypothetical protein
VFRQNVPKIDLRSMACVPNSLVSTTQPFRDHMLISASRIAVRSSRLSFWRLSRFGLLDRRLFARRALSATLVSDCDTGGGTGAGDS